MIDNIKFALWVLFSIEMAIALSILGVGLYSLIQTISSKWYQVKLDRYCRNQTQQHVMGIRSIGQQARSDMDHMYYDFINRASYSNRR